MRLFKLLAMRLNLFGEGGGVAAGGDGAGTGGGSPTGTGEAMASSGNTRRGKSGDLSNVVYGVQSTTDATDAPQAAAAESTEAQPTSNTLEDKRRAFRELVDGEYKDIYTEETQRIINRRFKETETLRSKVDETQPLLDMLSQRYNVKDGDVKGLMSAIESDSAYWAEAADEAGMTVEQYKAFQKLQRENESFKRAQQEAQRAQLIQEQTQKWYREAEAVKAKFPAFDFSVELANPAFLAMLKSGTPVEHAYKVIHYDEILGNAVNVTAENTQQAVVANIRARGARPAENGTASQSAFTIKDDVSKLTKADRAEVARRAARGERITFGHY